MPMRQAGFICGARAGPLRATCLWMTSAGRPALCPLGPRCEGHAWHSRSRLSPSPPAMSVRGWPARPPPGCGVLCACHQARVVLCVGAERRGCLTGLCGGRSSGGRPAAPSVGCGKPGAAHFRGCSGPLPPSVSPQGVCTMIAAFLHFFFLSSFCWVLTEAWQSYLAVIGRMRTRLVRKRFLCLGWGEQGPCWPLWLGRGGRSSRTGSALALAPLSGPRGHPHWGWEDETARRAHSRLTVPPSPLLQVCRPLWWLCLLALPAPKDMVHPASTWASRGGQQGVSGPVWASHWAWGLLRLRSWPMPAVLWANSSLSLSLCFPNCKRMCWDWG